MQYRVFGSQRRLVMRGVFAVIGFCSFGMALLPASAAAQESASIIGQVKDESGGVLPGVTITATSPALQVAEMTAVTNENGEYRLSPLPIGTYQVVYALAGFRGIRREDVRVTTGFVARLDVVMNVGALEETITVSGASPVVDVTSTSTSTRLTREVLETIPTARSGLTSMMQAAPGVRPTVDIGGAQSLEVPIFRAFGQTGQSFQTLEGVTSQSARAGATGNYFDFSMLEEVQVKTVGADADMPFRGIQLQGLVKSGSNAFHGSAYQSFSNDSFLSDNLNEGLRVQGFRDSAKLHYRSDTTLDLGGRIIRDKLWFYAGINRLIQKGDTLDCYQEDGTTPCYRLQHGKYNNLKVSYQMNGANKLVFFTQRNLKDDEGNNLSQLIPWETRFNNNLFSYTYKAGLDTVVGNSLVTTFQVGRWYYDGFYDGFTDKPSTIETTTNVRTGTQFGSQVGWYGGAYLWHHKGMATAFKPDLFYGNHEFKAGFDFIPSDLSRKVWPKAVKSPEHGITFDGLHDYQLRFTNGVPAQIAIGNAPVEPHTLSHYLGTFVQDNWVIARRLTLNLGLRFARDNAFVPRQCRDASVEFPTLFRAGCFEKVQFKIQNTVAPRLHTAWDVAGNGKTVIKGGWSKFDERRPVEPEVTAATVNFPQNVTFRWNDRNGNRLYDAGEVNLDTNGPDYLSTAPLSNGVPNLTNEKQPTSNEYMVSVERELIANTAIRITGIYSTNTNNKAQDNPLRPYGVYNIPITNRDPGPDGVLNNADDPGTSFTYWDYPAAYRGVNFDQAMPINLKELDATYKSYEIAGSRRLTNNWQFMASFSSTTIDQPAGALPANNPNSFLNVANNTTEWSGKVSGSYQFPAQVTLSAFFESRSGTTWQRDVLFRGGGSIPQLAVNVEPFGTRQLPAVNHLDLRLDKRFNLSHGQRLSVRMNAYNLTNSSAVLSVNPRSGPSFGRPMAILEARILDIAATYSF